MGDCSYISAGVTIGITSVSIIVRCIVLSGATTNTVVPMLSSIVRPRCIIIVRMTKRRSNYITANSTGLSRTFGCGSSCYVRSIILLISTLRAFVPMRGCIRTPSSLIVMARGITNFKSFSSFKSASGTTLIIYCFCFSSCWTF